jgi:predicted nuclease of predicted toxin-antitoxin system
VRRREGRRAERRSDREIIFAARDADAIVITKDQDFVRLLERNGPPLRILWVTCGNTSTARMREVLEASLVDALELFRRGEALVELSDSRKRGGE